MSYSFLTQVFLKTEEMFCLKTKFLIFGSFLIALIGKTNENRRVGQAIDLSE